MHGWENSCEEEFACLVHVNQKVASNEKDSTHTHTESCAGWGGAELPEKRHLNLTGG